MNKNTTLVKPVLVKSKEIPNIGDLCTSLRYKGQLLIFGSFENSYPDECKKQQLILISLDPDKKIQVGDTIYSEILSQIEVLKKMPEGDLNFWFDGIFKVIATQSQLSPKYINQFIEEYNKGEVKDVEIEMEEYGICKVCNSQGVRHCAHPEECGNAEILNRPKLTNGFITIVTNSDNILDTIDNTSDDGSDPIFYTEEEVLEYLEWFNSEHTTQVDGGELEIWFEDRKKKITMDKIEEALKMLVDLLDKSNVRKYTCINQFGYSQLERDIVAQQKEYWQQGMFTQQQLSIQFCNGFDAGLEEAKNKMYTEEEVISMFNSFYKEQCKRIMSQYNIILSPMDEVNHMFKWFNNNKKSTTH